MCLNDAGEMVWYWWYELKNKFPDIQLDEFIVMPNHIHGIINMVSPVGLTKGRPYRANT
jgi:REP element-mobilizing transposase RayT